MSKRDIKFTNLFIFIKICSNKLYSFFYVKFERSLIFHSTTPIACFFSFFVAQHHLLCTFCASKMQQLLWSTTVHLLFCLLCKHTRRGKQDRALKRQRSLGCCASFVLLALHCIKDAQHPKGQAIQSNQKARCNPLLLMHNFVHL